MNITRTLSVALLIAGVAVSAHAQDGKMDKMAGKPAAGAKMAGKMTDKKAAAGAKMAGKPAAGKMTDKKAAAGKMAGKMTDKKAAAAGKMADKKAPAAKP